jgi:hypothetical protein
VHHHVIESVVREGHSKFEEAGTRRTIKPWENVARNQLPSHHGPVPATHFLKDGTVTQIERRLSRTRVENSNPLALSQTAYLSLIVARAPYHSILFPVLITSNQAEVVMVSSPLTFRCPRQPLPRPHLLKAHMGTQLHLVFFSHQSQCSCCAFNTIHRQTSVQRVPCTVWNRLVDLLSSGL